MLRLTASALSAPLRRTSPAHLLPVHAGRAAACSSSASPARVLAHSSRRSNPAQAPAMVNTGSRSSSPTSAASSSSRRIAQVSRHLHTSSRAALSMSPPAPAANSGKHEQQSELPVQLLSSGPVRTLRLNRPKALNALNLEMVNLLRKHLDAIAPLEAVSGPARGSDAPIVLLRGEGRALCSGGDVLAVVNAARSDDPAVRKQSLDFFKGEYELDYRIASLARATGKTFISIMDGITMGGGVGLSLHAPFRIATERTMFAMPETGIGFFPDVGVTRVLARLDGPGASVGNYLGLTGARLTGEEAYLAGLATHFVPASSIDSLVHRLETLSPEAARDISAVDSVLSEFATNPLSETYASSSTAASAKWADNSALLGARRIALDWAFGSSQADAKAVVAALESLASGSASDAALLRAYEKAGFSGGVPAEAVSWAQETLKALRTKSPRSVVLAHLLIKTHRDSLRGMQTLYEQNNNRQPSSEDILSHPTARHSFIDAAFRLDMAIAARFCDLSLGTDFYEGVTFTLTKDPATGKRREGKARWADASIEDIPVDQCADIFLSRTGAGQHPRHGSAEFATPKLELLTKLRLGTEGKPVGPQQWTPAFNAFALPSEAELAALCEGSHPASGSVAIVEPEEIVSVLSGWRAGKRPLDRITRDGATSGGRGGGDGDKLGMLEKVREWSRRR